MHTNCRCSTSASMGPEGDVNYAKSFDDSIKQDIHESMWIYSLEDARKELLKSPVELIQSMQLKTAMLLSTLLICVCIQQGLVESNFFSNNCT